MKVRVDPLRCQGHNRCFELAGDLFVIDDIGMAHEHGDGSVPDDRVESARLAVANCPERAITLHEE